MLGWQYGLKYFEEPAHGEIEEQDECKKRMGCFFFFYLHSKLSLSIFNLDHRALEKSLTVTVVVGWVPSYEDIC